jgi:hypothetical protein
VVNFTATGVTGSAYFSIDFQSVPYNAMFYMVVGDEWKQLYPKNECSGITNICITGTTLSYNMSVSSSSNGSTTLGVIVDHLVAGTSSHFFALHLSQGWNAVSLPEQPADTYIQTVLADVLLNVKVVRGYDNKRKRWLRWKLGAKPQKNTLFEMEAGKGYIIYMETPGDILVYGVEKPSSITLYKGWNLVGYSGDDGADAASALNSITGKWKGLRTLQGSKWLGRKNITNFNYGKAYWIRMKQNRVWVQRQT